MKAIYFSFILLVALTTSCKKSDINSEKDLERSYKTWLQFKADNNNSYRYIQTTSSWVGTSTETIITVQEGKIVGRSFLRTNFNYTANKAEVVEQWEENEASLDTHENYGELYTLDEIYHLAKTKWLVKQNGVQAYFESKNNGLISSCGFVPEGCQDDCFSGITIKSIVGL